MKSENPVVIKSFDFALKVVMLGRVLIRDRSEYILSKQVMRSGTSIGANIEEALGGQSRADFYAKLSIAYKEARETSYWLRLLKASGYVTDSEVAPLVSDVDELLRIIGSIQISTKRNPYANRVSIRNS